MEYGTGTVVFMSNESPLLSRVIGLVTKIPSFERKNDKRNAINPYHFHFHVNQLKTSHLVAEDYLWKLINILLTSCVSLLYFLSCSLVCVRMSENSVRKSVDLAMDSSLLGTFLHVLQNPVTQEDIPTGLQYANMDPFGQFKSRQVLKRKLKKLKDVKALLDKWAEQARSGQVSDKEIQEVLEKLQEQIKSIERALAYHMGNRDFAMPVAVVCDPKTKVTKPAGTAIDGTANDATKPSYSSTLKSLSTAPEAFPKRLVVTSKMGTKLKGPRPSTTGSPTAAAPSLGGFRPHHGRV